MTFTTAFFDRSSSSQFGASSYNGSEGSSFISRTAWRSHTFLTQRLRARDDRISAKFQNFQANHPFLRPSVLTQIVKSRDSATNCVWDLRVFAFDNARIDTPYDGVHDGMGARHFQLVLAIDLLPKRRRPYRVLTSVRRTISTSNKRASRKAALPRSRRRTIDGATSEAARRPVW
jgi:hypothetical protein